MQETRQRIIEIMKVNGYATVDELSRDLDLTPVTIRHHLEVLRSRGLITAPKVMRKGGPGRPQHVYRLAEEADELFPKSYDRFAGAILAEMEAHLDRGQMNELIAGVAERLAAEAQMPPGASLDERLDAAIHFLNDAGYLASATAEDGRYRITVANCPYEHIVHEHRQPCEMDLMLVGRLLDVPIESIEQITSNEDNCTYFIYTDSPS